MGTNLSFTKSLCIRSYGPTPVCSWIFMFHIWEKTLKDERPHYLHCISGCAQGLATTATLPQCRHRRFLFCSMSYLLIYSSLLHPRLTSYLSPIKINPHLKIPTLACQRGRNQRRDGLSRSPSSLLSSAQVSVEKVLSLLTTSEVGKWQTKTCVCDHRHTLPYHSAYWGLP